MSPDLFSLRDCSTSGEESVLSVLCLARQRIIGVRVSEGGSIIGFGVCLVVAFSLAISCLDICGSVHSSHSKQQTSHHIKSTEVVNLTLKQHNAHKLTWHCECRLEIIGKTTFSFPSMEMFTREPTTLQIMVTLLVIGY